MRAGGLRSADHEKNSQYLEVEGNTRLPSKGKVWRQVRESYGQFVPQGASTLRFAGNGKRLVLGCYRCWP
jgi:hypothetical protein